GNMIFVQSDDRKADEHKSVRARADAILGNKFGSSETAKLACKRWFDVRAFGQLFALPKKARVGEEDGDGDTGISIGIRGPVTVQSAFSVEPIEVTSNQITKSVNAQDTKGGKRGSDTMGMKHSVDKGVYVFFGSMNPQLAEKTGFSDVDAEAIKKVLPRLFENDESSARPSGSMEVLKVIWWKHNGKPSQYSAAKVHRSLKVQQDGSIETDDLEGLKPEILEGF
ncbi:MAG: type I-C CRISPR-associated protein Cas7/Csd2, partial [Elusimicrobiota bacterium]